MQKESILSKHLDRNVFLDIVLPAKQSAEPKKRSLLFVNDGQDASEIHLDACLLDFMQQFPEEEIIAIAIHVGERKQEYGVAREPDYAKRGSKAAHYASFLVNELLPWAEDKYNIKSNHTNTAIIGFSLGALSAFDIAWNNSHVIGTAGLFSGSFWWRAKALEDGYTAKDRIAHKLVEDTKHKKNLRLWFQTGLKDESADRDDDGLIDSVGDAIDLVLACEAKGYKAGQDLEYVELGSGRHDHKTMTRVLPRFLHWWRKPD